jgi:hypothetical protein
MLGELLHDRRATVTIIMVGMIAAVIGVGAFAVEVGSAYAARVSNQRFADAAAYAGALAYSANGNSTAAMNVAVSRIATLNGLASAAVTASVVTSPTGSGNSAVLARATTSVGLQLARVFQNNASMSVSAAAYAELKPSGAACMVGLSGSGNSIIENGGATVVGTGCAVAAKSNLSLTGGSSLTAQGAYAGGTVSQNGGSTITTTPTANNIVPNYAGVSDPVAGNASLQAAFTALSSLSGTVPNPTTPGGGTALNFVWSPSGTCPPGGTSTDPLCPYFSGTGGLYNKGTLPCSAIDTITVAGGVSVHISAMPGCNYTVANGITNSGTLLQIDGTVGSWYVIKGSATYGINASAQTIFGGATTFWVGGGIKVGGGKSLTLGNATNFYVNAGITTCGSSTTNFTANRYLIQGAVNLAGTVNWNTTGTNRSTQFFNAVSLGYVPAPLCDPINSAGGGTFTFGDGTYSTNGNLTLSSGPTYFSNSQLSIHGNLLVSSGASLCGTPAPCGSGTSKMTIVDDGTNTINGGATMNIAAPLSGATYGIPGIVLAGNYADTGNYTQMFSGGTGGTYAGVIYFPNTNVKFSGGASTGGTNCFEIVANVIQMTGGSTTASTCVGYGASVGPTVATLVQ